MATAPGAPSTTIITRTMFIRPSPNAGYSRRTSSASTTATLYPGGDGDVLALFDGVLVMRYLFGFSGEALTAGALGEQASRDASDIVTFLSGCPHALDVDGNGWAAPLTDGMLLLRYLLELTGDELLMDAVGQGCSRCDATTIAARLADVTGK